MKPLFLRLKAFGPFANEIDVSFDRVFDGGLFLIHGRTGAGKTSLLDGLCFSLFGRPSSEEREKDIRGLRSDLASAATMTETELIFTIGLEAYRVHRIPTQPTPKKRGEGLTEHKGSAELYRLDGTIDSLRAILERESAPDFSKLSWIPLAGKVEAVDVAVENMLGMNERQFRQVVVLPQGKFREFLSSTSSDRQVILEKLFQTDRFSRLQQYISTRARTGEGALREATQGLQVKLEALGLERAEDIVPRKQELDEKFEEASHELLKAREQSERLSHELNQAKEYERAHERLTALTCDAEILDRRKDDIALLKQRTAVARQWAPYFQLDDLKSALDNKRRARLASQDEAKIAVLTLISKKLSAEKELSGLLLKRPSLEEISSELIRLRTVAVSLKEIEKASAALALDEAKTLKSQEQIRIHEAQTETFEKQRSSCLQMLFSIDEYERGHESTRLENEDLRVKSLELKFHHSEASRLASLLSPGAPCPVCGSREHPIPARSPVGEHDSDVTEEIIRIEKKKLDAIRHDLTERRTRRQSRLEPLVALIKTSALAAPLKADLEFGKQFELYETTTRALATAAQSIEIQRTEMITREDSIATARDAIELKMQSIPDGDRVFETVVKRGTELKVEQEAREPEIRRLEKTINQYTGDLSRFEGTSHALEQELAHVEQELVELTRKREDARPDTGTPPERSLEAALQASELEIESHSMQVLKVTAALSEVRKSLERITETRASSAIATEFDAASKFRSEVEQTAARMKVEIETLTKLENETALSLQKLATLKAESERAARMSALLTGDRSQNKMLVPLSRFVLQSRFEEVLEQANRRLARMSRGQFQLRRPALSRNLRDSQGLEIRVEDANAGTERHAGSLSGGESFMAALSLALGLADVVQADLGGVKLDSVLIDEGFGTLDSESLDLAMKTLVDLQAGGRIVGIISHVQEIKNQIPHRLEVTKRSDGSGVLWNVSN